MAITVEEMRELQPEDVVRVISLEEYKHSMPLAHWSATMKRYCGRELTVRMVRSDHIYVDENGYCWLPHSIDCVVYSSSKMEAPSGEDLARLLMSGLEDDDDNKENV